MCKYITLCPYLAPIVDCAAETSSLKWGKNIAMSKNLKSVLQDRHDIFLPHVPENVVKEILLFCSLLESFDRFCPLVSTLHILVYSRRLNEFK